MTFTEQLAELIDEQGNIEQSKLEPLMPWSKTYPMTVIVGFLKLKQSPLLIYRSVYCVSFIVDILYIDNLSVVFYTKDTGGCW